MEHKIIFTGPVGAGKTTAIGAISDIEVVGTESRATDDVRQRKDNTTVAMDYGVINLGDGSKVHLYGTPGQERFSFMWDILTRGGIGLVLLIDNARPDPLADLSFYVNAFRKFIGETGNALVVGITRMDMSAHPTIEQFQEWLAREKLVVPVFEIDGRDRDDVKQLMLSLRAILDPSAQRDA